MLLSLDLDGTLVHPAAFNQAADALGFGDALKPTLQGYLEGRISLEQAFWADVQHFIDLPAGDVGCALKDASGWLPGIREGISQLKAAGWKVWLTTDQPSWIADVAREFGVERVVCSPAQLDAGRITNNIDAQFLKWPNLKAALDEAGVDKSTVVHVGNGANDIPVWHHTQGIATFAGKSVASQADVDLGDPPNFQTIVEAVLGSPGNDHT